MAGAARRLHADFGETRVRSTANDLTLGRSIRRGGTWRWPTTAVENFSLFPVNAGWPPAAGDECGRRRRIGAESITTGGTLGHMVGFDAHNRFLLAADKGLDRVLVYRSMRRTGTLTPNRPPSAALPPVSGPRHFAFHPNGKWLFANQRIVLDNHDIHVGQEAGRAGGGRQRVSTKRRTSRAARTAEIAVHPSGRFVYDPIAATTASSSFVSTMAVR